MHVANVIVILGSVVGAVILAGQTTRPRPGITSPVMFDTAQADAILSALQVFPKDNAWNLDVSSLPVHRDSARIIASIGAAKTLDYNLDMNFIIVPRDQPRVAVRVSPSIPTNPIPVRSRYPRTHRSRTGRSIGTSTSSRFRKPGRLSDNCSGKASATAT